MAKMNAAQQKRFDGAVASIKNAIESDNPMEALDAEQTLNDIGVALSVKQGAMNPELAAGTASGDAPDADGADHPALNALGSLGDLFGSFGDEDEDEGDED